MLKHWLENKKRKAVLALYMTATGNKSNFSIKCDLNIINGNILMKVNKLMPFEQQLRKYMSTENNKWHILKHWLENRRMAVLAVYMSATGYNSKFLCEPKTTGKSMSIKAKYWVLKPPLQT